MTWARLETKSWLSTATPRLRRRSTSSRNAMGSRTAPLPMTPLQPGRSTPQGTSWRTNFWPLAITVWPALWPPEYRATAENRSLRTSTILPFPSSPHWAPSTTAVFARILILFHLLLPVLGEADAAVGRRAHAAARQNKGADKLPPAPQPMINQAWISGTPIKINLDFGCLKADV